MAGDREYKCVLDADSVMSRTAVLRQLNRSFPEVMFLAPGLREDDWEYFMDETMGALLAAYKENPNGKKTVMFLGLQTQNLPHRFCDLKEDKVKYYFNSRDGVLDAKGNKDKDSNLVFDSAQIDASRQIFYEDTDIKGFLKFVNEPIARGHGRVYMEVILTSVLPALYGWAGPFNQVYIKKLATIILEGLINLICYYATFVDFESLTCQSYYKTGPPEVAKTLRAKMALACGSSDNAFFSGSSSVAGIQVLIVQTMQL